MMKKKWWRVGELAKQAGLSVRTLHYYDEIGLLSPTQHSVAGYRLYSSADITRLHQIQSLKQLGFSLEKIQQLLGQEDCSLLQVVQWHMQYLEQQIANQQQLYHRLEKIAGSLVRQEQVSVEKLIETMEAMNMFEKYFTQEQLADLERRREIVGEDRLKAVGQEWPVLIAEVRAEMEKGTDTSSSVVQALAKRWIGLINEFTGGNPQHAQSLQAMYQQEQSVTAKTGLDPEIMSYIGKAIANLKQQ